MLSFLSRVLQAMMVLLAHQVKGYVKAIYVHVVLSTN